MKKRAAALASRSSPARSSRPARSRRPASRPSRRDGRPQSRASPRSSSASRPRRPRRATPSAPSSSSSARRPSPRCAAGSSARGRRRLEGPVRRERPGRLRHPAGRGGRARPLRPGRPRRPRREPGQAGRGVPHLPGPARRQGRGRQALARYLSDETLAGPAAAALADDRRARGRQSPRQGPRHGAAGPPALAVVDALGEMRSREAVKKLLVLAESADEGLRRAGPLRPGQHRRPGRGPGSLEVRVAPRPERKGRSARALPPLRPAAGRSPAGRPRAWTRPGPSSRATAGPKKARSPSEALALIVSILKDRPCPTFSAPRQPDPRGPRRRLGAGRRRLGASEATARWVEKAAASAPDVRAAIIDMLGRRGDTTALPFVRESLRSRDEAVRLAAIPAAARLGGEAVVPDIFGLVGAAGEGEAPALKTALLGFDGRQVVPEAVRLLDSTPHPGKAVLIDILGEKGARGEIERVFALAEDAEPATRAAALGALAKIGGEDDLPRLVALLETATDGDDIVRLQEAVAVGGPKERRPGAPRRRPGRDPEERPGAAKGRHPQGHAEGRRGHGLSGCRRRNLERGPPGPDRRGLRALPMARLPGGRRAPADRDHDREQAPPAPGRRGLCPPRRAGRP